MNDQQETAEEAVERDDHGWPQSQLANFRRNVKDRRERQGLSQGDIAEAVTELGLPMLQQTVYRIEAGSRAVRLEEAAAVAEVLGNTVVELFEAPEVKSLADALNRVEVESGGSVSLAAGEKLSAQAILAETADLLAESGKLSEQHTERVLAALAESVIGDARGAAERAATLPDHPARGKFGNYWLCAQREAMSALPGYRINVFEHGDQMRVGLLHVDPATELDDLTRTGLDPIDQDQLVELLKACIDLMNSLVKEDPDHREARRLSWLFDKFKR